MFFDDQYALEVSERSFSIHCAEAPDDRKIEEV
jgi:hypothetical protein